MAQEEASNGTRKRLQLTLYLHDKYLVSSSLVFKEKSGVEKLFEPLLALVFCLLFMVSTNPILIQTQTRKLTNATSRVTFSGALFKCNFSSDFSEYCSRSVNYDPYELILIYFFNKLTVVTYVLNS